jgi:hypothetical protein
MVLPPNFQVFYLSHVPSALMHMIHLINISIFFQFFLTLSLNLSFSKIKYKIFLYLLSGLIGFYDVSSSTLLSYIFLMFLSHKNLAYITIICVAIGIHWSSYFNVFFILLLILFYLLNFFDIFTFTTIFNCFYIYIQPI